MELVNKVLSQVTDCWNSLKNRITSSILSCGKCGSLCFHVVGEEVDLLTGRGKGGGIHFLPISNLASNL